MAFLGARGREWAALALACVAATFPACTFNPTVDVKTITCMPGDENTCPEDYTCVTNAQGVARCCRGKNGTCDQIPDASSGGDTGNDVATVGPDTSTPMDATAATDADAAGGTGGGAGTGGAGATGGGAGTGGGIGTGGTGGAGAGGRAAGGGGNGAGAGASGTGGGTTGGRGGSAPDAGSGDAGDGSTCNPECTIGSSRCGPNGGLQPCVAVSGCASWGAEATCGAHAACVASPSARCVCNPAPVACMNTTGSLCMDTMNLQACVADTAGCIYAPMATRCPTGMPCQGTFPSATCSCTNDPACNNVEGGVCNGSTLVHCVRDPVTRCLVVEATESCSGGQQCTGMAGGGACTCPAAPSACMTVTNGTVCMGNTVLSCTTNAKGCVTAATMATCTAGKPCGGALGSAACACVAVSACMGAQTGRVCQTTTAYVTCGANADGCPVNMGAGTCTVTKPCQGNPGAADCMCQSPPSQADCPTGMTAGSRCVGSMVYQCGTNAETCPTVTKTTCPTFANEGCVGTYPDAKCEKTYGYPTDLLGTSTGSAATLLAEQIQITAPLTLRRLGLFARAASMHVRMAIYTNNGGVPDTWRGSAILSTQVVQAGRNEFAVNDVPTNPVVLTAGTYWIVAVFEANTMLGSGGTAIPVRYQSWSPWNTPFPSAPLSSSIPDSLTPMNFYVVGVP